MKLKAWMRENDITVKEMTRLVNERLPADDQCTVSAVMKWIYEHRLPTPARIVLIEEITYRKVTLRDWVHPHREVMTHTAAEKRHVPS